MSQNKFTYSFNFRHFAFMLFVLTTILAAGVRAADGDLDAAFDGDGKVITNGFLQNGGRDVVVQPDGKIIVVGGKKTPTFTLANMVAVRYNADGSLDTTFGTNGEAVVTFLVGGIVSNSASAVAVALQADGKILLGGSAASQGVSNPNVRLNANGTLDTTFGSGGRVITDVTTDQNDLAASMVFDETRNKIYLAGVSRTAPDATFQQKDNYAVVRYNGGDGSLDTTFNGTGKQLFPVGDSTATLTILYDIALQSDGKTVVTGRAIRNIVQGEYFATARITLDGSLDSSFGDGGIVLTNFPSSQTNAYSVYARTVSILPNGKIFVAGEGAGFSNYAAAQYNADGSLDSSFGTGGKIYGTSLRIADSALQSNGKITVVGLNNNGSFVVGRLNANGSPDTTFGTNGVTVTSFSFNGNNANGNAFAVALQSDGKIVASGGAVNEQSNAPGNDFFLVARYNGTAALINNPTLRYADFDGDGKSDVSVFRNGTWFINPSGNPSFANAPAAAFGVQFGQTGDVTVPADYDGDGKSDIAVWRGGNFGYFYILNSVNNTFNAVQFGKTGDNPTVTGDWDADGKADFAVYRGGAQSFFYYRPSSQSGVNFIPVQWGTDGDTPIFGDFDGDRKLDATVYRPANNTFYVRRSSDGAMISRQWGEAQTDAIFAGDFDGDGKSDFAVQRFIGADAGTWYVAQSGGTSRTFRWGTGADLPVPADYDGDGRMDFAVFRRSNSTWYIYQSATNTPRYAVFGASSDLPLQLNLVR
jgi:uncharacterized delta-60 repeat protein